MLGHVKRVLIIGAHPDDEDTELLTLLVRGMGAEAAYLSLNRGEGGQNLIGSELGEALGILRSEELLAARRLDGAGQFFTRAYDFGYSKSLDDTWNHWPRDSILKDVVRVVRRFRPQIIVSIFSGTPRDGHGQHQAAGWVTREAFRMAGDGAWFPELGSEEGHAPWTPLKLYRSARFDTAATTMALQGGALDPAVGQSFHQIAMAGRSLHRSQDMGQLQRIGPSAIRLALLEDRTGTGGDPLFAGIDTLAGLDHPVVAAAQLRHRARAEVIRRQILVDAIADDDRVIPGQRFHVALQVANAGADTSRITAAETALRDDMRAGPAPGPFAVVPGRADSVMQSVTVGGDARFETPYYLTTPRIGSMYQWPRSAMAWWGEPFDPPPVAARLSIEGVPAPIEREASRRVNDQATGEVRRPLQVVPRVDVRIDGDTLLVPTGESRTLRLAVTLTHGASDSSRGQIGLDLPAGWAAVEPQQLLLTRPDQREAFVFAVRTPARLAAGRFEIRAVASLDSGERFDAGHVSVDYPHIRPRVYLRSATVSVVAAPLELPDLRRVGYVRGAADRVPEALAAAGVPIELIDSLVLERGNLRDYDVIVVGPRAYETDPALVEHNARLLDYARSGGLLIVQYQQYQFIRGRYAPYPLTINAPHDRVTDETAPVRMLRPDHPALAGPNRIGAADWDGWVQERGLYFARTWDDRYTPLVESHDPGEPPREGGLLIAPLGRGTYVYTGLAFFRQLPAGVPGAFRLMANLLALPGPVTP